MAEARSSRVLDRLARAAQQLSLRARLLLGLVVVVAVGLVVADLVVYSQISSYLNGQVDSELQSTLQSANSLRIGSQQQLPLGLAVEATSSNGTPVSAQPSGFQVNLSPRAVAALADGAFVQAQASEDGTTGTYRLLVRSPVTYYQGFNGPPFQGVELFAAPLGELQGTLNRLLFVEVFVSAAVLAALAGLGYLVVQVGMRPLVDIEETAGAIAAGDLSRRVETEDERTEVGRLGIALNAMLATIEHAFQEQRASEERLRQFLADASHELRTPVTSIRGYAELFRRGAAGRPEDLAQAMRRIEDESVRMGVLVDDLLLLARLDQGRPLESEPVDLAALAVDAAADGQVLAPDRELAVEVDGPVRVIGDEQRLRQVAGNLVQNALRHTPAGTPVTVSVHAVGDRAELRVADRGPGLSPEHAARVFERFYRADPSRTRGSGGAGLGLSIVASIAAAHGGVARVETAPGEGATFVVDLPLADAHRSWPAEDAEPRAASAAPPAAPPPGAGQEDPVRTGPR